MKHIDLSPFIGKTLSDTDWQRLMMRILFTPRPNGYSYADAIIRKSEKQSGLNAEHCDPLLSLLGFSRETLPKMSHIFNSEMGNLFETIVKTLFLLSNPRLYSDDFTSYLGRLKDQEVLAYKKTTADFIFGKSAIETKYRYGSSEGLTKQKDTSKPLEKMGLTPVMICFRLSPNTEEIQDGTGWTVFEGQEALEYIQERTGFDLMRIFQLTSANPVVASRINKLQTIYDENTRARLEADFAFALSKHRTPIHKLIAEDDDRRSEFLDDIGFEDDTLKGFLDHVLKTGPEILSDPAINNLVSGVTTNYKKKDASSNPSTPGKQ